MHELHIPNEQAFNLANQLSQLTGEPLDEAVIRSVKERIERFQISQPIPTRRRKGIADELLEIGRRCAALPDLDTRAPDDILYDEYGLPKDGINNRS